MFAIVLAAHGVAFAQRAAPEPASVDPADLPPSGPADVLPLDPVIAAAMKRDEESNQPAGADWGASPNGPVVE